MSSLIDMELMKDMIREDTEDSTFNLIDDELSSGVEYLLGPDEFDD